MHRLCRRRDHQTENIFNIPVRGNGPTDLRKGFDMSFIGLVVLHKGFCPLFPKKQLKVEPPCIVSSSVLLLNIRMIPLQGLNAAMSLPACRNALGSSNGSGRCGDVWYFMLNSRLADIGVVVLTKSATSGVNN